MQWLKRRLVNKSERESVAVLFLMCVCVCVCVFLFFSWGENETNARRCRGRGGVRYWNCWARCSICHDITWPCQVPPMVASLEMPLAAVVDSVGDFVTLALLRCNFWQYFHQTTYTQSRSKYGKFTAMPCPGQLSLQKCIYMYRIYFKHLYTHMYIWLYIYYMWYM